MGSDVAALIGLAIDTVACLTFLKVYKWCKVTTDKVKVKQIFHRPRLYTRRPCP